MSDSEGSAESVRGSENFGAREEAAVAALPNRQNPTGDKLEEFEKLLQSMMPSRTPSQEEEEEDGEEEAEAAEENESERKMGACLLSVSLRFATVFTRDEIRLIRCFCAREI